MIGDINRATDILQAGGIICHPTETVYGLGCLPNNTAALEKLIALKQRAVGKGFILLAASADQLKPFTGRLSASDWLRIATPRDRATTWTVPAAKEISPLLIGDHEQIAIRIAQHELVRQLCKQCNSALVSTSANISGEPPARQAADLPSALLQQIDLLVDAPCGDDPKPSRIIDLKTGKILRD